MSFIGTGCGRSGSQFMARLLTDLGVRTAHEEFFTAHTTSADHFQEWLDWSGTSGEISGLAACHLPLIPTDMKLIHIVRNPVAVIASLIGLRDLEREQRWLPNVKFNFRHIPEMNHDDAPVVLAMKYWVFWNRRVSSTFDRLQSQRVLVECMLPRELHSLIDWLGYTTTRRACEGSMEKFGSRTNSGARSPSISLRTLPPGALKDRLVADAIGYGYTVSDLENFCPLGHLCCHCMPTG
jgi:hypothetical protein